MTQARASLREPLLAFAAATALGAAFGLIGTFVPLVHKYLALLIAIIFFQTPIVAARRAGRDIDYRDLGLRADPIGLNLKVDYRAGPESRLRAKIAKVEERLGRRLST